MSLKRRGRRVCLTSRCGTRLTSSSGPTREGTSCKNVHVTQIFGQHLIKYKKCCGCALVSMQIRIQIQGFDDQKFGRNLQLNFYFIFAIYLSLGLHKERPSYRRSLHPSKENI
jgi:hypothetical protein